MLREKPAEKNAAIFVDDGGEDAYEFASNYIWFDAKDPRDTQRAWSEAQALWDERSSRVPAGAIPIEPPHVVRTEPAREQAASYQKSA